MIRLKTLFLSAAFLSLASFASLGYGGDPSATSAGSSPAVAGPPVSAGVTLTDDSLRTTLENLGFQPRRVGDCAYEICVDRDGWQVYITVSLSPDKTMIWFNSGLGVVSDDVMTATPLLQLLAKNDQLVAARFAYYAPQKKLYLEMPLANVNVTPALLRAQIDTMDSLVINTADLWNTSKWPKAPQPTAAVTPPALPPVLPIDPAAKGK